MRATLLLLALLALAPTAAACDGLSPGDELNADNKRCTLAWLVADAKGLYFATAGHCIAEGSRAYNPALDVEFGTGVFSFDQDGPGVDFALIEIDPDDYDKLNPRMCEWGGPTGVYRDNPSSGMVYHFGYGDVLGQNPVTRARPGFELYWDGGAAFYWTGLGVTGDSGSAVVHADGRAIGVLTHLTPGMVPSNNGGTHLDAGFALAAERGYDLRLVLEGEDPVTVLRELQGASPATPPPTSGETPDDANGAPSGEENGTASPSDPASTPPTPATPDANATDDEAGEDLDPQQAPGATSAEGKGVPAPALPLLVAGVLLVAALRRR